MPRQRDLYLAVLIVAAAAIALFSGPVAFHRLAFRRHAKARVLRAANVMAVMGLAAVGLALSGAVLLVTTTVAENVVVLALPVATFTMFAGLWFVFPFMTRGRDDYE